MRGSIRGQTLHLFNASGINCIGESKFQAKDSARLELANEGRGATSTAIAEKTGIHSIGTRDNYLEKWQEIGRFAKEEFAIRDLEKLTADHVRQFLNYKIELGVSYSHWSGYCAAVGKLENALNAYSDKNDRGNAYDFRSVVHELRPEARSELPRFEGTRNYDSPESLTEAVPDPSHQLAARIQHESGLRIAGACSISASQLKGLGRDVHTGKLVGLVDYIGKGGKPGTAQLAPETYQRLADHIRAHGQFKVSADGYRASLKAAADRTGQDYNGSHGLRWNFAQERFSALQAQGHSYEKCLGVVSNALGHNRIEITKHYLFGN
jgi:hypothetical protein